MATPLRQSTAIEVVVGRTIKAATGSVVTAITPASIDCGLIKGITGTSIVFTTIGAANHITSIAANPGYWHVALTATDTNTVGPLRLTMSQAAVFLAHDEYFQVIEEDVYDALFASGGAIATAATVADAVLDELITSHTTANSLSKGITDILADTGTDGVVLAASALSAAKIASGAITAAKIASGAITSAAMADNVIHTGVIAADTITSALMADSSVAAIMAGIVEGTTTMAVALQHVLAMASGNVTKTGNAYAFKNRAGVTLFTLTIDEDAGTVTRS